MNDYRMLIDGARVAGEGGHFEVLNPATETAVAQCTAGSLAQLDLAVAAARRAFAGWQLTSHAERSACLQRIADAIEQDAERLARLIVSEQGKPLALAFSEVMGGVAWTRYAAAQEIPFELIEDNATQRVELHLSLIHI